MPDREKVNKGLECCKEGANYADPICSKCPYKDVGDCVPLLVADALALLKAQEPRVMTLEELRDELVADALALLKAQEPRVMTLEEVRDEADHMYLEKHSKTGSDLYGCAIRGDCDGYGIELLMSEYDTARERWMDYGKIWRCWTSRPTDEQREKEPWNG